MKLEAAVVSAVLVAWIYLAFIDYLHWKRTAAAVRQNTEYAVRSPGFQI